MSRSRPYLTKGRVISPVESAQLRDDQRKRRRNTSIIESAGQTQHSPFDEILAGDGVDLGLEGGPALHDGCSHDYTLRGRTLAER